MLFHITQTHDPDHCPIGSGGPDILHAKPGEVPGLKVMGSYGAFAEHTMFYMVEVDTYDAVVKFLLPGFKRCQTRITPVGTSFVE